MQNDAAKHILIADDTDLTRKSVISMLKELGFSNAGEARDGLQALTILKSGKYDLLICDWNMPNLDGISLVRMIRNDPDLKSIKIMMLTAESKKEHVLEAQAIGIDDYIVKPFTANTLEQKMGELFGIIKKTDKPFF